MNDTSPPTSLLSLGDLTRAHQLKHRLLMPHTPGDYQMISNDLRLRVLEGEDIDAVEMLSIVEEIRQGRRAAARATTATSGSSPRRSRSNTTNHQAVTPEDLHSLLDQQM